MKTDDSAKRTRPRGQRAIRIGLFLSLAVLAAACVPALSAPGTTSAISFVSTSTANGWKFDYYINRSYPCSISGFQTFTIATKVGSSASASKPLWVHLHGGGVGYFDSSGTPRPNTQWLTQEADATQRNMLNSAGFLANVRNDPAGFRLLGVSYCNRDLYAGGLQPDPNNPNPNADGSARTTNGLYETKAAIQFAEAQFPTSKYFLHGGSAGSAGSYPVAWALQQQGMPPAGDVADASVVNVEAGSAAYQQGACRNANFAPSSQPIIVKRVHPDIAKIENEPDRLVAQGKLTVPLLHIWNHGDVNTCGTTPMVCPERDGSTPTLGVTDCTHDPLRQAVAALGPTSRSKNLPLCVSTAGHAGECDKHVVTNAAGLTNTDPSSPPDYFATIMNWVHARLADPPAS